MGKDNSTTVDSTPWAPMQPHILGAAQDIRGTVGRNQGNLDSIAGLIQSQLPGLQNQAFAQQPGVANATGYANDVLGGRYLNQGNPYLQGMINQTSQNVGNQVNSTFSQAGRTGGGNHVQRLTEGLANAENNLRYQDYGAERDRMQQAGALVPSLAAAQYSGIQPFLAASQTAGQLPYAGIQNLAPLLGGASSAGQQTQNQPSNLLGNVIGGIGAALPFIFSDRRLKTDISIVRHAEDGMPVSKWRYSFDPSKTFYVGPIADDVEKYRPWALGPERRGYATVNYANLGAF